MLLVHGPFADTSSWAGVIARLQAAGIDAVALANPLRGLSADARYIASAAEEIDGPTILAGHSYGGAVTTVAAALTDNVVGLVYVTAFALDEGESTLDVSAQFPESPLTAALRPAVCPGDDDQSIVELYIDRDAFPRVFAADLSAKVAAVAAATQRPIAAAALEERATARGVEDASVLVRGGDLRPGHSSRRAAVHGRARCREATRGRRLARRRDLPAGARRRSNPRRRAGHPPNRCTREPIASNRARIGHAESELT